MISFPEKEKEREGEFCRFQRHKNQGRIILLFQQGKHDVFQGRICSFDGRFFQHVFRGDFCRFLKKKIRKEKNFWSYIRTDPYSSYIHMESVQSVRNWPYDTFFEADCVQNFCWAVFLARGSRRINSEISAGVVRNLYSSYGTGRTTRFSRQTVCIIFAGLVFLARGSRRINSEISAGHSGIDWHVYQGIW